MTATDTTRPAYRFLGTTDDVDTCDCCGRTKLKSTVVIELIDGGEPVFFGVTCAALALKSTVKEVRQGARAADTAKREAELAAQRAKLAAETEHWFAWLDIVAPGFRDWQGQPERFRQIESLGGYGAARARYTAESGAS